MLSLIFWSLILVISVKYLVLVLRADNKGEGGIIALTALVSPPSQNGRGKRWLLILAGLFGAALLYGDSMITPAISVVCAIEGLEVPPPVFESYIIPITVGILIGLFLLQSWGTAVFMDSNPDGTHQALLHNLKHNKILHERVILLTLITREVPRASEEEKFEIVDLGKHIYRIRVGLGFTKEPDVPCLLSQCDIGGTGFDISDTTFFLGRETILATERPGMAIWREKLFAWMSLNAQRAASHFNIPSNRVVEIGAQVEM